MLLDIRELQDGRTQRAFTVPNERYVAYVQEADELYEASGTCEVKLTLDKIDDVLSVRGTIDGALKFACASCLAERNRPLHIDVRWTLMPRTKFTAGTTAEEEVELSTDDLDVSFFDSEEVDLEDLVREAILLELDPAPRCEVDECEPSGYKATPLAPESELVDARWAPLAALRARKSGDSDA